MKPFLVASLATFLCSGCAIVPELVDVHYTTDPGTVQTRVAPDADVRLQVADARHAESPNWIADKKNGYGMRLASIGAQRPVADLVRDAVAQELSARGILVGERGPAIVIEVLRLEAVYQNRFLTMGSIGYADFAVQVRRLDGGIAYARTFSVATDGEDALVGTAGQVRRNIESTLTKIVAQLVSDPAFIAAVSSDPHTT